MVMMVSLVWVQPVYGKTNEMPITITRTITPSGEVLTGEELTVHYTLTPGDIPIAPQKPKEIVLVIDKSGSMNWNLAGGYVRGNGESRMSIAKAAATEFVEYFNGNDQVKISIVTYASQGQTESALISMAVKNNVKQLKELISNISAGGGTNIGDGIRYANYILKNGSSEADKFMVFLTDGEPTVCSYRTYIPNWWWGGTYSGYYMGQGQAPYIDGNTSDSLGYAKKWASEISKGSKPIHGYYVAFSNSGANKLKLIAEKTTHTYYKKALTKEDLAATYQEIAGKIDTYASVNDIYFEETLPEGLSYVNLPEEFNQSGRTVNYAVPAIEYKLNGEKTFYHAEPVKFEVKVKLGVPGIHKLESRNAYIRYTDLDGETIRKKEMQTIEINAFEVNAPTIEMSQDWSGQDRTFTLKESGSSGMHFNGTTSVVSFTDAWQDEFLGESQENFTIRTILKPRELSGEFSNHKVENVFFAKASKRHNDNIEMGIDAGTKNLMLYLDCGRGANTTRTIGNGELTLDAYHEVIVTFNKGKVTVFLDGIKYTESAWNRGTHLTQADRSPMTIGGTLHRDIFFKGTVNSVQLYEKALDLTAIYSGTDTDLIGSYNGSGNEAGKLLDMSGHNHHSSSVDNVMIQDNMSGNIRLQYKKGVSGTWINYTPGKRIVALEQPGELKIYGRAIHDKNIKSQETMRVARVTERGYIDNITLQPDQSVLTVKEQITMDYVFTGSSVMIANQSAMSVALNNIAVTLNVPDGLDVVSAPTGFVYNQSTKTVTGTMNGMMRRQANGRYLFDQKSLQVVYKPENTADVAVPINSVTIGYKDYYAKNISYTDGNKVDLDISPTPPTIDIIAEDDIIDQTEVTNVVIEGTADAGATVLITIDILSTGKKIKSTAVANASGHYQTAPIDFSDVPVNEDMEVKASVTDSDGDTSHGTPRIVQRQMIIPDIDIL